MGSLKLKFTVSCSIVWVLPLEASWIIQRQKVRTLPVPPWSAIQWKCQSSADPLEAGARNIAWPGDDHSPSHAWIAIVSPRASEYPFFFYQIATHEAIHESCPMAPWMNNQIGHLSFTPVLFSRSIKHTYSTLSTGRTGHQNGSERYAQKPSGRNSVYFAVSERTQQVSSTPFEWWFSMVHRKSKGDSENLMSLTPLKTALEPPNAHNTAFNRSFFLL